MIFDELFDKLNNTDASGSLKDAIEDFIVIENNDISFTNQGEHLWLKIQKKATNTSQVATFLAQACKVSPRQVAYAGLKDRQAVTQQWFSIQLPKISDTEQIQNNLPSSIKIIEQKWHQKKLKTGCISDNEFKITINNIEGDHESIKTNINFVKKQGVPNYFGPQRFGHQMGNIQQAQDWFSGHKRVSNRNLRSLLISTARSHIFNSIVAQRIKCKLWQKPIEGDIMQLDGSHSWFYATDESQNNLMNRLKQFDIHITAALWGEDSTQSTADCADLEETIAASFPIYQSGFEKFRVKQDRRSIRLLPQQLNHSFSEKQLKISFKLPPGCYATSVLREIININ